MYPIVSELKNYAHSLRSFIIDLLYPVECIGCSEPGTWLCSRCQNKMPFNYCQVCPECHTPTSIGEYCPLCREGHALDGVIAFGDYGNKIMKGAIKKFKFSFIREMATNLTEYANEFIAENEDTPLANRLEHILTNKKYLFIPVPLHPRRLRWRGFNQAKALLEELAKGKNISTDTENLKRIRHKKPQSKLAREKRLSNLTDCFQWTGGRLEGKDIILVDDVMTTGSTLEECAKELKKRGARRVWGLVLARGK